MDQLVFALVVCFANTLPAQSTDSQTLASGAEQAGLEDTRKIYRQLCADCHGNDGRGSEYRDNGISIPDFASKKWVESKSTAQLRIAILLGKGEEMPPFEDEISAEEASLLVALIRDFAGLRAVADSRPEGSQKLQKDMAAFQNEWSMLANRWEQEYALLKQLADTRQVRQASRGRK